MYGMVHSGQANLGEVYHEGLAVGGRRRGSVAALQAWGKRLYGTMTALVACILVAGVGTPVTYRPVGWVDRAWFVVGVGVAAGVLVRQLVMVAGWFGWLG